MRQSFLASLAPLATLVLLLSCLLSLSVLPFLFLPRSSRSCLPLLSVEIPARADASSYQSAESVNRRGNVFQPALPLYHCTTITTMVIRDCRRSDSRHPFLILPILGVVFPFASRPASSSSSCFCSSSHPPWYLYGLGLPSPRALVGESKFNGDRRVKPSISRPFLSI